MSFSSRHPLLTVFLNVLVFRQGPQILPASGFLFGLLLAINFLTGIVAFMLQYDLLSSLVRAIADLSVSLGIVYLFLVISGKGARVLQTIIALLGAGAILNILSLPLLAILSSMPSLVGMAGLLLYLLLFWQIAVAGYIFHHALSVSVSAGIFIAVAYVLFAMAVFYSLFPVE